MVFICSTVAVTSLEIEDKDFTIKSICQCFWKNVRAYKKKRKRKKKLANRKYINVFYSSEYNTVKENVSQTLPVEEKTHIMRSAKLLD